MAEEQNTSSNQPRTFDKALVEDIKDFHLPDNSWTQARNAINNSITGDLGRLGNEPGNLQCVSAPYTIIGFIHIIEDRWAVYSTDNTNSEIGLFIEGNCGLDQARFPAYTKIVNDPCLKFNQNNLIIGASRPTSTCTYKLYWDDGLNPSRVLEIDADNPARNAYTDPNSTIPWIQDCAVVNNCNICTNTSELDCDRIRLAQFMLPICPRVMNGISGGNLLNGSYMVAMAYAIDGQKISDWYVSNVQSIFTHQNSSGSLDVYIDSIDQDFTQVQVAVISIVNQQFVARDAGIYSTRQTKISFDSIFNEWPAIPVEQLPITTPIVDKTDGMYNVGEYLIRSGPTSKFDFNYQPLANQIVTKWQSVEYPGNYYFNSGNNIGYMRDEVYAFFIQWIYDTGDKSASYHIPGRPSLQNLPITGSKPFVADDLGPIGGPNAILGDNQIWQVYNTAVQTATPGTTAPDGGLIIAEGLMGYWESTELYPDNTPQIWNANIAVSPYAVYNPTAAGSEHNLCGRNIRHHKFPEDTLSLETNRFNAGTGDAIRIMGVKFENIKAPLDNNGDVIPGIIGYRILRSTRNGNKSIIAKGMINNMHEYTIPGIDPNIKRGLYPNYPYNDLRDDPFLSTTKTKTGSTFDPFGPSNGGVIDYTPMPGGFGPGKFSQNFLTFHSPETNFNNPYLAAKELRIYQNIYGNVEGRFDLSEEHPREQLISDYVFLIAVIAGIGVAALNMNGERTVTKRLATYPGFSHRDSFVKTTTYNLNEAGTYTGSGAALGTIAVGPITAPGGTGTAGPFGTTGTYTGSGSTTNNVAGNTDNSNSYKSTDPAGPDPNFLTSINTEVGAGGQPSTAYNTYDGLIDFGEQFISAIASSLGVDNKFATAIATANGAVSSTGGAFASSTTSVDQKDGASHRTPSTIRSLYALPTFLNYFTDGTDSFMRLIRAFLRFRDYAVRYHSHGFYNNVAVGGGIQTRPTTFRSELYNQQYIDGEITDFNNTDQINNLYRSRTVALHTAASLDAPAVSDHTRYDSTKLTSGPGGFWPDNILGNPELTVENLTSKYVTGDMTIDGTSGQRCSSHYVALKVRIANQYGQLNRIVQVPTDYCYIGVVINPVTKSIVPGNGDTTKTIFGGDIYVNRYTEKNTFFYFYNWLYGQPDGAQLDYNQHVMVAYPKYWANFNKFQTSDFTTSLFSSITPIPPFINPSSGGLVTPKDYYALDGPIGAGGWISNIVNNFRFDKIGWFYLFNSGVRDFFVESEINTALRDYGELPEQRFFNPYRGGSTYDLFRTGIIKSGNYYKYDISLSISKLPINYSSWASTQPITYDPYVAETCFVYQPTRVIYSLPAQFEGISDGWKVFLANNYYDFNNIVTCIKPINKSGAMIFFDAASPVQFQGTDQLQTTLGTKLTIGDGGLFSQPMQQVINVDLSHEYASCQNRLSVINTPAGVYWISQNQGKIFQMLGQLKEVSNISMKWWFAQYLPYSLTEDFPDFELIDNPVIGIACQSVYDNENGLVYFCKKDYKLRKDIDETLEYIGSNKFSIIMNGRPVGETILGDPLYFEDASWTVSYDPKTDGWISYHDWHPNLNLPGKNTFMTVSPDDGKSIWIHNERCDLYCNYYGKDYPFEVEFTVNTGGTVNTLRNVEYIMEAYKYAPNCYDRFHSLDFNFDEAVVYNTEQVSGLLKLNLKPKQDPALIIQYPIINPTNIDIIFSKEENKYRFNQFWDITADRGEYNLAAQRPIWNTEANGYVRVLNPNNLNYNKDPLQRKKFRHYTVSVLLRKLVSGDKKMLVMIADAKNLYSPR